MYEKNKNEFIKIYRRTVYESRKQSFGKLLGSIDSKNRIAKLKEEKGSLVLKLLKANMISNGEIDLICFLAYLEKIKNNNAQKDLLLIIDEVFDYLYDINIIVVQKFISYFIKKFSSDTKRIFPIIMTHLDPNVFKNFCFSDMKIYYLNNFDITIDNEVKKIITNRKSISNDKLGKYYFHFHPGDCDLSTEFNSNRLTQKYDSAFKFKNYVHKELLKYTSDQKSDYLMVLCSLRIKVEEFMYHQISAEKKAEFLEEKMTVNKIVFSEENGVSVPENFKLLSVLYNDFMHLDNSGDPENKKILFLSSKLNNVFIKSMIKDMVKQMIITNKKD